MDNGADYFYRVLMATTVVAATAGVVTGVIPITATTAIATTCAVVVGAKVVGRLLG